MIMRVHTPD